MITEDEARSVYGELLKKLRDTGGSVLVDGIEKTVGRGRVSEDAHRRTQERLPAATALGIAVGMLATWIETAFLISEAKVILQDALGGRIEEIRWAHDRIDIVEPEPRPDDLQASDGRQATVALELPDATHLDGLRNSIMHLRKVMAELVGPEDG